MNGDGSSWIGPILFILALAGFVYGMYRISREAINDRKDDHGDS
ncbi:MAG: hypothetical protein ACE5E4_05440 [Candidatus Binatia bacterium]